MNIKKAIAYKTTAPPTNTIIDTIQIQVTISKLTNDL